MRSLDRFSKKLKASNNRFVPIFSSALFMGMLALMTAPYMVNIGDYVNVSDAAITHLIVDANYGVPEIAIYAENGLGHQGRIEVTPWGEISRSYPYGS